MAQAKAKAERGPTVAGIELGADRVRAVVGHREASALRVTGVGQSAVRAGAMSGGLVIDRVALAGTIGAAMASASSKERPARVVAAIDGDDVRTYHISTTFEREGVGQPITAGEVARATAEARAEAEKVAREAAVNDPALRGIGTVQLRDDVAGLAVDGRALTEVTGFQGRYVEVRTDVALAPLVLASAATASLGEARHRGTVTSGAYALGRLLATCGIADAGVLRLGPDVTAIAVLRGGRVVATRVFGLGRDALLARAEGGTAAAVWARCVVVPLPTLDGALPSRWHIVGVPDELVALPRALGDALAAQRGGDVEVVPLRPALASRVFATEALHADDLVAAGAASLAAEIV